MAARRATRRDSSPPSDSTGSGGCGGRCRTEVQDPFYDTLVCLRQFHDLVYTEHRPYKVGSMFRGSWVWRSPLITAPCAAQPRKCLCERGTPWLPRENRCSVGRGSVPVPLRQFLVKAVCRPSDRSFGQGSDILRVTPNDRRMTVAGPSHDRRGTVAGPPRVTVA